MDFVAKHIATQEKHVDLLNSTNVRIRRDGALKGHPVASISAVLAFPEWVTAKLRPARKTWVQPGTIAHIPLVSAYTGHGYVKGRPPFFSQAWDTRRSRSRHHGGGRATDHSSNALRVLDLEADDRYDPELYRPL